MFFSVDNNNIKDTAGVVKCSCGVVFILFCFCYIYFIQGEVLAKAQFVYSGGITSYHSLMSPLIVAGVLQIIQLVFFGLLRLPQKFYALSYFPSMLLLTALSNFDEEQLSHFSLGSWSWVFPLSLLAYFLVVSFLRSMFKDRFQDKNTYEIIIVPNCIILMIFFLGFGSLSLNNDVYLYELKTERLISEKQYEDATNVGERSVQSSVRLTQLRMYALAKQNLLPERIFDFPQYYGVDGLIPPYDTIHTARVVTSRIYADVGAIPGKGVKTVGQYLNLVMANDSMRNQLTIDYSLCYKLLKKDLKGFEKILFENYNPETKPLPRAYQEALLLKAEQDGDSLSYIPQETLERYKEYKLYKAQFLSPTAKANKTRQSFGNTYWWYYDN